MINASRRGLLCRLPPSEPDLPNGRPTTVAFLGLPLRLVAVDAERERRLADRIAPLDTLQAEQKRLFRQIHELLMQEGASRTSCGLIQVV
jgi:hypothetical protein